jgi:hypothetical protein
MAVGQKFSPLRSQPRFSATPQCTGCESPPYLDEDSQAPLGTTGLAMLANVSVGSTPQTTDIFVCRRHVKNVVPTRWRHSLMSANFSAVGVVSVRPVADTHSCMYVRISTNEVVIHEDKKIWNVYRLFFILSDLSSSQRIYTTLSSTQKKAKEFLSQTRHVLTLSNSK